MSWAFHGNAEMLGWKERDQFERLMTGSLRQLVPDDHVLARVDRVLDLSWLRSEVADLYYDTNGRPGIDPEVAVRLMLRVSCSRSYTTGG
jgi:hypothetical protein